MSQVQTGKGPTSDLNFVKVSESNYQEEPSSRASPQQGTSNIYRTTSPHHERPVSTFPSSQTNTSSSTSPAQYQNYQLTGSAITYEPAPTRTTFVTSQILHGTTQITDRYGHKSFVHAKPKASIITEGVIYDVPCYVKCAEDTHQYLQLPYGKTELALDQQLVTGKKKFLFNTDLQKWIFSSSGFIESEVNRMVVLGVHKPTMISSGEELLVTALNREMLTEGKAVKWTVISATPGVGAPSKNKQYSYIALASDPSYVLDVQKVGSSVDIKGGYRVILRKNAGFSDNRQKWIIKPKFSQSGA